MQDPLHSIKSKDPMDALGDRMKLYESRETERFLMPKLPVVARMDGNTFSKFTRGMDQPYDLRLRAAMLATTRHMVELTGATAGYTQSDEITLVWYAPDLRTQMWFNGRIMKLVGHLAAKTTSFFQKCVRETMPEYEDRDPTFDARIFNVPTLEEAVNALLWRELDATKNSITQAAQTMFSHKQLMHKTGNVKQAMMLEKGVNWNDYPIAFKRGVYVRRQIVDSPFDAAELATLPPGHHAHSNPGLMVKRSRIMVMDMPPIRQVPNRLSVIFYGAEPGTPVVAESDNVQEGHDEQV